MKYGFSTNNRNATRRATRSLCIWACMGLLLLAMQIRPVFAQEEFGVADIHVQDDCIFVVAKPGSLLYRAAQQLYPERSKITRVGFDIYSVFDGQAFIYLYSQPSPSGCFLSILRNIPAEGVLRFRTWGGTTVSIHRKNQQPAAIRTEPPYGIGTQTIDRVIDSVTNQTAGFLITAEPGSPLALSAKKSGYDIEGEKALTPSLEAKPFLVVAVRVGEKTNRANALDEDRSAGQPYHAVAAFMRTIWEAPASKVVLILSDGNEIEVHRKIGISDSRVSSGTRKATLELKRLERLQK